MVTTLDELQIEDASQRRFALQAEGAAEGLVHEGESLLLVAAQDDVALMVEEIAIARLALAQLPLQVAQGFEACLRPHGKHRLVGQEARLSPALPSTRERAERPVEPSRPWPRTLACGVALAAGGDALLLTLHS